VATIFGMPPAPACAVKVAALPAPEGSSVGIDDMDREVGPAPVRRASGQPFRASAMPIERTLP
jgi:hypothetical protein